MRKEEEGEDCHGLDQKCPPHFKGKDSGAEALVPVATALKGRVLGSDWIMTALTSSMGVYPVD
jgi:hypothetical protein